MWLENPRDLERRPGRLERDLIVGPEACSEELELLHRCLDTTCKPQP